MVDILVAPTRVLIFSLTIIFKIVYDIFLEVYWFCRSTYSILQETMSNTKIGLSNPDNKLNKAKKPQHYFKKRKNTKKMNISKPEASNPELASIGHRQVSGSDNWKKFLLINSASNTVTHVQKPKQQNICSMRPKSQSQEQNYSKLSDKSNARGKLSNVNINPGDNYSYRPKKNLSETVVSEKSNKSLYVKKLTHKTEGTTNLSDASLFNKQATSKPNSEEDRANMSKDDSLKLTKQIAIDCEMVGVEVGVRNDMLARVSLVNAEGDCVYDKFVKPTEPVLDYRTRVSGVRPKDLENAADFKIVQKEVADILKGRVLVGHALKNDLKVLFLTHPKYLMRDTSKFRKFREGRTPSLKNLAKKYLGVDIQEGEHSSVQDALAAMQLYKMFRKEWESTIRTRKPQQDVKGPSSKFVPNGL